MSKTNEQAHGHGPLAPLGMWMYIMTDIMLFGTLFATYIVLSGNTYGGPSAKQLFDLNFVFVETMLLLTSSFTVGLVSLALNNKNKSLALAMLGTTFILGFAFICMEFYEFSHLISQGYSWQRSAFLSAFFVLVGTHGAHVIAGLIWLAVLFFQIMRRGTSDEIKGKFVLFGMFWHFLDIVWIFVFTLVYLMGAL